MLFERIDEVSFRGVTKRYGDHVVVDDMDLEVSGGELLVLFGPSGSGKTTTLRMVNRLIEPDTGVIEINGVDISRNDPVELRRSIGYVIQQIGLFPHMSVGDNITLLPRTEGWSREERARRAEELLNLVSLSYETFAKRLPRELSGGQQQRVAIARALAMDPPLLLMDEPFGALDPILRKQLQGEFLNIKERIGRTIIFVTHDVDEAFRIGDRIAIMRRGRIVQLSAPEELILNPADEFVTELIGGRSRIKHLDALRVEHAMTPLGRECLLEQSMTVKGAIEAMESSNTEFGLVSERGVVKGIALSDLFRHADGTLEDAAHELLTFDPGIRLTEALREMKKSGAPVAVVVEGNTPRGLLFPDDVLYRLL